MGEKGDVYGYLASLSRFVKSSLQRQEELEGVVQQMVWPPQALHVNIVESAWDYMETRVKNE